MELRVFFILFGDKFGSIILQILLLEHFFDLNLVEETVKTSSYNVIHIKENEKACEILYDFEICFIRLIVDWKYINEKNWDRSTCDEETNAVDDVVVSIIFAE